MHNTFYESFLHTFAFEVIADIVNKSLFVTGVLNAFLEETDYSLDPALVSIFKFTT